MQKQIDRVEAKSIVRGKLIVDRKWKQKGRAIAKGSPFHIFTESLGVCNPGFMQKFLVVELKFAFERIEITENCYQYDD